MAHPDFSVAGPTLDGQATRDITYADVYDIFPFNNYLYVYQITYAELLYYTRKEGISTSGKTYFDDAVHSLVKDGTTIYEAG